MSTKIYEAYRFPIDQLNSFIDHVRPQMLHYMAEAMAGLMSEIKEEIVENKFKERYSDGCVEGAEESARMHIRLDILEDLMKEEHTKYPYRRSIFDPECGLNIWLHEGYAYVMPIFSSLRNVGSSIDYPDFAFDYSYWNNSDRPENVTDEDWEEREKTWGKICLGDDGPTSEHNARRLYHSAVSIEGNGEPCFEFHYYMKTQYCDTLRKVKPDGL